MIQPFPYYGGKADMVGHLLSLVPPHKQYIEPFAGASALFWAKSPSENEVLNDTNGDIVNFYRVLKTRFYELKKLLDATLHSEATLAAAAALLRSGAGADVERAHAFWVQATLSFSYAPGKGFAFSSRGEAHGTKHRIDAITCAHAERLRDTEIFCRDAVDLIAMKDGVDTFIYADPPYIGSDMGPYAGYKHADFVRLLDAMAKAKGMFLLSSYPGELLDQYRRRHGWGTIDIPGVVAVSGKRQKRKLKTECLTFNFSPPFLQMPLS